MQICRQGNGHYTSGLNNQDFYFAEGNLKLLTDGCSSGLFSEVGTRLFSQQFAMLPERLCVDKFEENVETVFKKISSIFPTTTEGFEKAMIDNMLFTIVACFELEDKFVVKFIGDGYIIAINNKNAISYIRLSYGEAPPYYAYNKIAVQTYDQPLNFKTFEFPKEQFKKVGIASDGLLALIKNDAINELKPILLEQKTIFTPEGIVRSNQNKCYDDITILI